MVDDHKDIDLFNHIYDKYYKIGLQIRDVDEWDGISVKKFGTERNVKLSGAMREIAEKAISIAHQEKSNYLNFVQEEFDKWDRDVANVLYNLKGTFRRISEECTTLFLGIVYDYADTQRNTYLAIVLSAAGGIVLSILSLIPFIVRAHTSVSNVFKIFLRIAKNEISELIVSSENYLTDTNKHFAALRKQFDAIDFREVQREEQKALEAAAKQNRKTKSQKEEKSNVINESMQKLEEDDQENLTNNSNSNVLTSQLEAMEIKRKEENLTNSSAQSRNVLMMEIVGIILIFVIYFIITIVLRVDYFDDTKTALSLLEKIARRDPFMFGIMFFAKEDFATGSISYDTEHNSTEPLFWKYYHDFMDNEMERESHYRDVAHLFPGLSEVMTRTYSSEFCDAVFDGFSEIKGCLEVYENILAQGLEAATYEVLLELESMYFQLENYLELGRDMAEVILSDVDMLSYMDLHTVYLTLGSKHEFEEIDDHAAALFESIRVFDTYDLAILLVLLVFVILFVFRFFLNQFEFSLWKTKRMLGILPSRYMAIQLNEIKSLIKRIS